MHRPHPSVRLAPPLLAACLLIAGAGAAQEDAAPASGPLASFPTLVRDFGEVDRGKTLSHAFVVRNEGDAPLEVLSAKPT